MEFQTLLESRRSVRAFDGSKSVTEDQIRQLVDAGIQAPSWKNAQTARYYCVLDEAKRAEEAALALFGGKGDLTHMPTVALSDADIEESGMSITRLLVLAGIEKSNSAAIRSVREGGISVNDRKVTDTKAVLDSAELADGIILKKGKKTFVRLIHKD